MTKRTALLVIVFCVSIFATLVSGEIIIRCLDLAPIIFDYKIFEPMEFVANPKICYKMKPFGHCEGGRLNSEGFKDMDWKFQKDDTTIRIIMLGDSITKGTGVSLGETFSDQLENMLNQKSIQLDSGFKYDVMNFGVGGYNIVSEIELLKEYGLKYDPDIVVLNYFFNDNEEYSYNFHWFMNNSSIPPEEKNLAYQYYLGSNRFRLKRLFFHSRLFVFCWIRINQIVARHSKISHDTLGVYSRDIVLEKIGELKRMGQRHGFIPVICMHPALDYDTSQPDSNYKLTKNTAERMGIPCVDLRRFYQRESSNPEVFLQNSYDRIHPNSRGHRLVAQSVLEALEKENLVEF